jgi:hypothetical protein
VLFLYNRHATTPKALTFFGCGFRSEQKIADCVHYENTNWVFIIPDKKSGPVKPALTIAGFKNGFISS